MKRKLMFISDENELNTYEKDYKKVSYRRLIEQYMQKHIILCNNIVNIDENLFDNIEVGNIYDEENDCYIDIYQYYIIDLNEWELEEIKKCYSDELIIAYSEKLDNYVLLVDHFGTGWDYVLTDVEYTTNFNEWLKWKEEQEG